VGEVVALGIPGRFEELMGASCRVKNENWVEKTLGDARWIEHVEVFFPFQEFRMMFHNSGGI